MENVGAEGPGSRAPFHILEDHLTRGADYAREINSRLPQDFHTFLWPNCMT
jgi:hypothetical protein